MPKKGKCTECNKDILGIPNYKIYHSFTNGRVCYECFEKSEG